MNSGQKIGLSASVIKQKREDAKTNKPEQSVLVSPINEDKQRLRKKI
jgi:hypothetical protein